MSQCPLHCELQPPRTSLLLDLSRLLMSVPSAKSGQMPMTGKPSVTVYVAQSALRSGSVI